MNQPRFLVWLLLAMLSLTACDNTDDDSTEAIIGNWTKRSQYEGLAGSASVSFIIGDKAYMGLGTDGVDKFQDFWQYDPAINT